MIERWLDENACVLVLIGGAALLWVWNLIWNFVVSHWPCISSFGLIGYLCGSLVTRKIMAPAFCPNCIRVNAWVKEFKTGEAQKAESRHFFSLRRRNKGKKTSQEPPDAT